MAAPSPPFAMPSSTFVDPCDISLPEWPEARNVVRGGKSYGRIIGAASMTATITTAPLKLAERGEWRAFFNNLRGSTRTALIYHPLQCYPASYTSFAGMTRAGGGAFDGTCSLSTITNSRELDLSTLPASFVLLPGDRLGFEEGGRYAIAEVVQQATANGSGVVTVYIEPPLFSHFTTAATVRLYQPKGEFILEGRPNIDMKPGKKPVSFTAVSRIF